MHDLVCSLHPESRVRRFRTNGPNGPGVYPQCLPANGELPHLLNWSDARDAQRRRGAVDLRIDSIAAAASMLSPSELRVLRAAANGLTSLESALELRIGSETIKTQRRQIMVKLGARNIAQAAAIATAQGILAFELAA